MTVDGNWSNVIRSVEETNSRVFVWFSVATQQKLGNILCNHLSVAQNDTGFAFLLAHSRNKTWNIQNNYYLERKTPSSWRNIPCGSITLQSYIYCYRFDWWFFICEKLELTMAENWQIAQENVIETASISLFEWMIYYWWDYYAMKSKKLMTADMNAIGEGLLDYCYCLIILKRTTSHEWIKRRDFDWTNRIVLYNYPMSE